jgi:hypothetical protein
MYWSRSNQRVIDHYNNTRRIGPVNRHPSVDKQNYGKDSQKKGDKSMAANPAISDGDASSLTCQLCHINHSATNCPLFLTLRQQLQPNEENFFQASPTKTVKGGEQRQAKASQGKPRPWIKQGYRRQISLCLRKV